MHLWTVLKNEEINNYLKGSCTELEKKEINMYYVVDLDRSKWTFWMQTTTEDNDVSHTASSLLLTPKLSIYETVLSWLR